MELRGEKYKQTIGGLVAHFSYEKCNSGEKVANAKKAGSHLPKAGMGRSNCLGRSNPMVLRHPLTQVWKRGRETRHNRSELSDKSHTVSAN